MSIKTKELTQFRAPVRYMNGTDVTLKAIQTALNSSAEEYGVPIAFNYDETSSGLFGDSTPCLVAYHPDHPRDYFKFCIQRIAQGKIVMVYVYTFGRSDQLSREALSGQSSGVFGAILSKSAWNIGASVGHALAKGISSLGRNTNRLEAEKSWYGAMEGIFDELIS